MATSSCSSDSTEEGLSLIGSVLCRSREISQFARQWTSLLHRRTTSTIARRAEVLSLIFEEILLCDASSFPEFSLSVILWLREIIHVLQRFKKLLVKCFLRMSRVSLTLRLESVARAFYVLDRRLSALIGEFPVSSTCCGTDVEDLVKLLQKQSRKSSAAVNPEDEKLRCEVLEMIDDDEMQTTIDDLKLENLFQRLGINDSRKLCDEIDRLELEICNRIDPKRKSIATSLLGLLRYGKCILFGESTSESHVAYETSDITIPADLLCPISLGLMRDPVVVSSGQTYDRESISGWINSGHATCPKTAQPLSNSRLVPNRALRNIIRQWCNQNDVPFDTDYADDLPSVAAPLEAAKTTILLLVRKLQTSSSSPSADVIKKIVNELRLLTKSSSENRSLVAEDGAVPLLVSLLDSKEAFVQVNAITSLLNLSILPDNKKRIMQAAGGLDRLAHLLRSGATWQARENAAATLLSISSHHVLYRKKIAMVEGVAEGLSELVKLGPAGTKMNGLLTMLQLAGDNDNISRLVDGGALTAALDATAAPDVAEIALAVVGAIAKRGGAGAVAQAKDSVSCLAGAMKRGTDRARETAAAALVLVCSHGGGDAALELAAISGVDSALWKLMWSGSERGRMTAASLCRMCHQ